MSQSELRKGLGVGVRGASLADLIECANQFGLTAYGCAISFGELWSCDGPVVLHTKPAHFVVCDAMTVEGARIYDPSVGEYVMTAQMASSIMTGAAIRFGRAPIRRRRSSWQRSLAVMRRMRGFGRRTTVSCAIATLCTAALFLALSTPLAALRESMSQGLGIRLGLGGVTSTLLVAVFLAGAALMMQADVWARTHLRKSLATTVCFALNRRWTESRAGDVPQRLIGLWNDVDPFAAGTVPNVAALTWYGACSVAILASAPRMGADGLGLLSALCVGTLASSHSARRAMARHAADECHAKCAADALRNLADVSTELRAGWEVGQLSWIWLRVQALEAHTWVAQWRSVLADEQWFTGLCVGSCVIAVLGSLCSVESAAMGFSARPVSGITVWLLVVFNVALPLRYFLLVLDEWVERVELLCEFVGGAHADTPSGLRVESAPKVVPRATTLGEQTPDVVEQPAVITVLASPTVGRIGMKGSLVVQDGGRIAVVGPNGAGKSHFVAAVAGLRQVVGIAVTVDGRAVTDYDNAARGVLLRYLPQRCVIPNTTVAGALVAGNARVQFCHVRAVAEYIGLDADIQRLPLGYATALVNDAECLSAAQRQLLLVVRTLSAGARITLLDDPLQYLDKDCSERVLAACERFTRTLIVTDHDGCRFAPRGFDIVPLGAKYVVGWRRDAGSADLLMADET